MKAHRYMLLLWFAVIVLVTFTVSMAIYQKQKTGKDYQIIYIPKTTDPNNDFWTFLIEGVEMAAEEYKVHVTVVAPESEEDYEKQNQLIAWAINKKPDAILLSPCSYTENTEMAKKVKQAGITLVLIDSSLNEDIADATVATNNVKLGGVQGAFIKQFLADDSKMAIIGHVQGSSTAIEREEGVRKGLGEYEDKIVDVVFCDSDYYKAYQLLVELLDKYPDISLIAGLNEYSAVGVARAIRDLNLTDRIKVVGTDSSLEEIQMLEEGIFEGIVIQNPFKMGYMGVDVTMKLLKGEKTLKNVDSGCELITRENVYTEENQKLLFPFKEE
jgi:ribose transport system substrate-binding protein